MAEEAGVDSSTQRSSKLGFFKVQISSSPSSQGLGSGFAASKNAFI